MAVAHYPIPPWWAMKLEEEGGLGYMWPELAEKSSQEISEMVVDNGSTYWVRTKNFLKEKSFFPKDAVGYVMPFHKSIDIDTAYDFRLTEYLAGMEKDQNP